MNSRHKVPTEAEFIELAKGIAKGGFPDVATQMLEIAGNEEFRKRWCEILDKFTRRLDCEWN